MSIASSPLGRPVSEETRLKISNSLKGRSLSELVREKMSFSRSDETKKILSEQRKGRVGTFSGKQHSEETKKKMSEVHGTKVEVFNKDTLETIIYPSYAKAAEALGCGEGVISY